MLSTRRGGVETYKKLKYGAAGGAYAAWPPLLPAWVGCALFAKFILK